jgi:glycosyltransferase involved in cell wall biosynthesis
MKILHTVEFYHPSVGGMQEAVRQISERLVKMGHEVTIATKMIDRREKVINGVKVVEFDVSGNLVSGFKGDMEGYRDFLLNSQFDIITNFACQQWTTDIMLTVLDRIKAKKVFAPTGLSALHLPNWKGYFDSMKSWFHKYDMNVFLSDCYMDIEFARDCGVMNYVVIPNGASDDEFTKEVEVDIRKKLGILRDSFLVLHVGSHTGIKGHKEAIRIFSKAGIRDAVFLMVANAYEGGCLYSCNLRSLFFNVQPGRNRDGRKIIVISLTREETIAAFKEADLFLFPSNIECSPLVLFECMASRTPFLSTDAGNTAEIINWSGAGKLLPTIKDAKGYSRARIRESASMLADLRNNATEMESMKDSGYRAWRERFTWGRIAKDYERLYRQLIEMEEG